MSTHANSVEASIPLPQSPSIQAKKCRKLTPRQTCLTVLFAVLGFFALIVIAFLLYCASYSHADQAALDAFSQQNVQTTGQYSVFSSTSSSPSPLS